MKLDCTEANHVCDKSQYKEASFWEKIRLNIHLIYCRACRKYSKNNSKLTSSIKSAKVSCMEEKAKKEIKETVDKAIQEVNY